ncbi:PspC domain-containing protein, partial [Streptomyces sp. NPDC058045]|uniref:PspC domain-containing protein n=1 Tax=Streptomyces sp. NPDC058045 TaxID=3346311 RepID=UPI0036E0C58C
MPDAATAPTDEPRPPRKLYRSSDGRWLGGVARGLAGHLGLPVVWVRVIFLGLFLADGLGALLYAAFWFFVPLGVGGVGGMGGCGGAGLGHEHRSLRAAPRRPPTGFRATRPRRP